MKNVLCSALLTATSILLLSACASNNTMGTANNAYQGQSNSTIQNGQGQNEQLTGDQQLRNQIYDIDLTVDQQLNLEADMQALNLAAIIKDNQPDLNLTVDQQVKLQSIMDDGLGSYQQKLDDIFETLTSEQRQELIQMHTQYVNTNQSSRINR